ncbi:MAG: hypothetical protein AAF265_05675 [Pseudomonadota bacterium]
MHTLESLYFTFLLIGVAIVFAGLAWIGLRALRYQFTSKKDRRDVNSILDGFQTLIGTAVVILISYPVYRFIYPDTYTCHLVDGGRLETAIDLGSSWVSDEEILLPAARIKFCIPEIETIEERFNRAFPNSVGGD